jgi:hypothetical protein
MGFKALDGPGLRGVKALDFKVTQEHLHVARLSGYRERLSKAIQEENYEEAARLRDLIQIESILAPLREGHV